MSPRAFLILAGITAVGVVAAGAAVIVESRSAQDVQLYDEPMFPDLVAHANDVAKIVYTTPTDHATIQLKNGQWVFADRFDYPVPTSNVRSLVASVAALRRFEPKTDDPAKYSRLSVEDAAGTNARSRQMTFENAAGQKLAAVVVGRASSTMIFDPLGGTYVRVPGEARSWLVRGTVALPPTTLDWMNRQIIHVPGPEVNAIQIREGGKVVFDSLKSIDENGVARYQLVPKEDKIQAADSAVKQVASGIVSLNFDDVKPAAAVKFPDNARELTFTAGDGMVLKATVATIDALVWAKFDITMTAGKAETERAKTARESTAGWAFALPSFKSGAFLRPLEELREAIPDPNAVGAFPGLPPGAQLPPGLLEQLQRQQGGAPAAPPPVPGVNLQGLRPNP